MCASWTGGYPAPRSSDVVRGRSALADGHLGDLLPLEVEAEARGAVGVGGAPVTGVGDRSVVGLDVRDREARCGADELGVAPGVDLVEAAEHLPPVVHDG